ncbi:MAG: radical SAM protein [Candidatus Rokubacteria bacterium]|nr:radical SAM protein [Candidatus Rokubacteria bacterium]
MAGLPPYLATAALRRSVPLSVHVDLTMRCNEVCAHCYRVVEAERPELTLEELRDLFEDLARLGTLYLTFSGGEIFLRPDLLDIVAEAKRRRFDVRLKTNAMLVSEARARALRQLGVRQVDVSVYSADAGVHDDVTGVPGSLARTVAGIARLREAGLHVRINCPLMTVNVRAYRDVQALAERLDVTCGFDPMITARNDGDRAPVRLRIGGAALREVLRDPTLRPKTACPPGADDRPAPAGFDDVACGAGHVAGYVSAYGDVMPCVALPIACGNVREAPFSVLWRGAPRMLEVRAIRVRDLHTCAGCEAAAFCTRCPGQALVEDGDLRGPSLASCEHAMASAEMAGYALIPPPIAQARR